MLNNRQFDRDRDIYRKALDLFHTARRAIDDLFATYKDAHQDAVVAHCVITSVYLRRRAARYAALRQCGHIVHIHGECARYDTTDPDVGHCTRR